MAILKSLRRRFLLTALLLALTGLPVGFAQQATPEYKLKAVFLYNFAQFVDWPTNSFADNNSPLIIGVLGKDPFGQTLDETVADEAVKNRKLVVRRFKQPSEVTDCHVLFVSSSHAGDAAALAAKLKDRAVLTVGDAPDFIENGGLVRFFTEKNKLRFAIRSIHRHLV